MIKRTKEELSRLGKMNCLDGRKIQTDRNLNIIRKKADNYNYKYPSSLIEVLGDQLRKINHPTQKPLELIKYLIKTYSNENDLILDNCMGSGTTAIACLELNRNFIGMEISQKYYNLSNKRIENYKNQIKLL